ncbi:unnamed protein product, partial [Rotaria magnacalcarata]
EDDDQEFSPLTQQTNKISTFDDDLARKVEQCFRNNTKEQQSDVDMIETDESNQPNNQNNNNKQKSSTRRRSRFRFSFSNNHNSSEEDEEEIETNSKRKSRLFRTLSASIINHENETTMSSSRRRKSYSTTGLANELKNIPNNTNTTITTTITKNNCTEQPTNIDKKSTKIKSSLANRVKRAFFRPHS